MADIFVIDNNIKSYRDFFCRQNIERILNVVKQLKSIFAKKGAVIREIKELEKMLKISKKELEKIKFEQIWEVKYRDARARADRVVVAVMKKFNPYFKYSAVLKVKNNGNVMRNEVEEIYFEARKRENIIKLIRRLERLFCLKPKKWRIQSPNFFGNDYN